MNGMPIACALLIAALLQTAPTPDALQRDVARLAAADSNDARFDALTALLREHKLTFDVETFTLDKPRGREPRSEGRNVVVSMGGGDEHLVIGAHYDASRLPDGTLVRGAVDNAASSVMLVHLAAALRAEKLSTRVHIVWFDMEELGLVGSARYAERHAARKTMAMLNYDINAYGDTVIFGPSAREDNAVLKKTLLMTCAELAVDCLGFAQMPPGDDRSFTARGVPTLSMAMLPAIEAHQMWLLMNAGAQSGLSKESMPPILQTIHTPADTMEKVSGETIARALRLATALVRTLQ